MALPTSGPLRLSDIYFELATGEPSDASLFLMSDAAGFSPPYAMSNFYGFSNVVDLVINVFIYSTEYRNDSIAMEVIPTNGPIPSPIYIQTEIEYNYAYQRYDFFRDRWTTYYYDRTLAHSFGPYQTGMSNAFRFTTVFNDNDGRYSIRFIRSVNYTFVYDPNYIGTYNVAQVNIY